MTYQDYKIESILSRDDANVNLRNFNSADLPAVRSQRQFGGFPSIDNNKPASLVSTAGAKILPTVSPHTQTNIFGNFPLMSPTFSQHNSQYSIHTSYSNICEELDHQPHEYSFEYPTNKFFTLPHKGSSSQKYSLTKYESEKCRQTGDPIPILQYDCSAPAPLSVRSVAASPPSSADVEHSTTSRVTRVNERTIGRCPTRQQCTNGRGGGKEGSESRV